VAQPPPRCAVKTTCQLLGTPQCSDGTCAQCLLAEKLAEPARLRLQIKELERTIRVLRGDPPEECHHPITITQGPYDCDGSCGKCGTKMRRVWTVVTP
jgi:hypothetical protein